jgi:hypothetical protein
LQQEPFEEPATIHPYFGDTERKELPLLLIRCLVCGVEPVQNDVFAYIGVFGKERVDKSLFFS